MGPFLYVVEGGKAFCERPFALYRQQAEKDKQNVDVAPPLEKPFGFKPEHGTDLCVFLLKHMDSI